MGAFVILTASGAARAADEARDGGEALLPGSFYRGAPAPDPEPVYKLVVGGDVSW